MTEILHQAEKVASSDKRIIIVGEYGSGKSWLAQKIHKLGKRHDKPFILVDCRIMEEHEASERIFGYLTQTPHGTRINHGIFEQAKAGTIFFECFDSLPEDIQREVVKSETSPFIQRAGSLQKIKIDQPRLICSLEIKTHHEDRHSPLLTNTILTNDPYIIGQPPLRQRREDIPSLIKTFLYQQLQRRPDISTRTISPEVVYQCLQYDWPGNVKQLKNAVEQAAITAEQDEILPKDLPISVNIRQPGNSHLTLLENSRSYKNAEQALIKDILKTTKSIEHAARLLGLNRDSLSERIIKLGLLPDTANVESDRT